MELGLIGPNERETIFKLEKRSRGIAHISRRSRAMAPQRRKRRRPHLSKSQHLRERGWGKSGQQEKGMPAERVLRGRAARPIAREREFGAAGLELAKAWRRGEFEERGGRMGTPKMERRRKRGSRDELGITKTCLCAWKG